MDTVFAYPGGAILPLFDDLHNEPSIRVILTRHEQGGIHAADGYARTTGKTGVCIVTSGPGATNTVTGLATANFDSVPIVCISGQVPRSMIGNDAFQEADTMGLTPPDYQTQLPHPRSLRVRSATEGGLLHCLHRPSRSGGCGHSQGHSQRSGTRRIPQGDQSSGI